MIINGDFEGTTLEHLRAYLYRAHVDGVDVDWTDLPTFGGEPIDARDVWSWDSERALVGACAAELEIVPRESVARW